MLADSSVMNCYVSFDVDDIREILWEEYEAQNFVIDPVSGSKTIEMTGVQFLANSPTIFGAVNNDYVKRELEWYKSMSLNVNDIPGKVPEIWKRVATPDGRINSNYGWAIFSEENGNQYKNAVAELKRNPTSRRAQMIYTRPSMWTDYNKDGMSDFMCCSNTVHHIREHTLLTHVYFRSNDAFAGYRNDYAWMLFVHKKMAKELRVIPGDIVWHAASLHLYEPQFYLAEFYGETGRYDITKKDYEDWLAR